LFHLRKLNKQLLLQQPGTPNASPPFLSLGPMKIPLGLHIAGPSLILCQLDAPCRSYKMLTRMNAAFALRQHLPHIHTNSDDGSLNCTRQYWRVKLPSFSSCLKKLTQEGTQNGLYWKMPAKEE
ncbi:hypothetical protein JRQ81_007352, partial [Phrynocephalus forsythii]